MLLILSPKQNSEGRRTTVALDLVALRKDHWCERGDLNPHALRHRILRRIPSVTASYGRLRQVVNSRIFFVQGYGA
jgi:hypothetical protein